jgi:hypothetical protein
LSAGRPRGGALRLGLAGGLAVGLTALLGFLARAPLAGDHAGQSALVLAWRVRGEEVVECRPPTEAELADLPVHMRNPDACIGDIPPFSLEVTVDGQAKVSRTVRPAGVRGDRPLYVYEELWLDPGPYALAVSFRSQDGGAAPEQAALQLDTSVRLRPGQILLVTRGSDGRLEVREPER